MTFQEAHDLIDLLLDKADQAYFTTAEKDKFLTMAIMEWYENVVSDYGNNPSQDHHEAAKYIVSEIKTFKDSSGSIRVHNNTSNTTPYPYNTYVGLSYPLYSIIDLRVRTSSSASWESVNPAPPGVVNDNVSDPFNKPTSTHRRYNMDGTRIQVHPNSDLSNNDARITVSRSSGIINSVTISKAGSGYTTAPTITVLDNTATTTADLTAVLTAGAVSSVTITNGGAGSTISSQEVLVSGSPTSSSYYLNYFKYPILSNVAGGSFNEAHENPGTSDIQLGAGSLRYGPKGFDDTATGVTNWGCGPEAAESIVKKAVRMMTANIESPLYQVNSIEEKRSE
jgi:hypothetical protein